MAEIPIQEKKSRSILPLILALVVVAALIWYFLSRRGDANTTPGGADSTKTGSAVSGPQQMAAHFQYIIAGSTYGKAA